MRLKNLSISKESPNIEGRINFCQETLLGNTSMVHCITGSTGSGKTSLLQALASVIWSLSVAKDNHDKALLPDFAVTVVYDLEINNKLQTICFRHNPGGINNGSEGDNSPITEFIVFKESVENITNWDDMAFSCDDPKIEKLFSDNSLTNKNLSVYLPENMFIYTSGKTHSWSKLFNSQLSPEATCLTPLLKEQDLELAICVLALGQQIKLESSFGSILNRLGFINSLKISLEVSLSLSGSFDSREKTVLNILKRIATTSAIDPNNDSEHLAFEFPLTESHNIKDRLALFNQLRKWQQMGLLKEVNISLNKAYTNGQIEELSYDCLSDGEQSLLSQVALFSLLSSSNKTLILLDEPEKSLNDYWKRELVALINESLGQTNNSIVFTCNSALPITDLFHNQLTVINKVNNRCLLADSFTRTFAASPAEIMRDIFDCQQTIGEAACRFLNSVLPSEDNFDVSRTAETIEKLERVEEILGGGYYQLEFRLRIRALKKLAA